MAHILVIDDEPNIRKMVGMALAQNGHCVEEAADGPEGLGMFGDGSDWKLVLLDQRMPGMEGVEVLRRIREMDPGANVVFMTAFGTLDLALDVMAFGATDFLRKPFPLETLRGAAEAALRHRPIGALQRTEDRTGSRYSLATFNGYVVEPLREPAKRKSGEIQQTVSVREPNGNLTPCIVVFPADFAEHIHRTLGDANWPVGDRFWRELAEEMLAKYVWENAQVPMGAFLRWADYRPYVSRWLGAVVGERQAA